MAMLAEVVDAVIGVDTHRDFNQVEIAYPSGAVIATRSFSNDSVGYAETLAWVFEHAPGRRARRGDGVPSRGPIALLGWTLSDASPADLRKEMEVRRHGSQRARVTTTCL